MNAPNYLSVALLVPDRHFSRLYVPDRRNLWSPIWSWREDLRRRGFKFSYLPFSATHIDREFDFVCVPHRVSGQRSSDAFRATLSRWKSKAGRLIWFDEADSTGSTQFEVLPIVDKYLKRQWHKDVGRYQNSRAADRVHEEYLNQLFGIDSKCEESVALDPASLAKLGFSWNFLLSRFEEAKFPRLSNRFVTGYSSGLSRRYSPGEPRYGVGRLFRGDGNDSISVARNFAIQILSDLPGEQLGRTASRKTFQRQLFSHRANVSPFGQGELCYRDFEIGMVGSILLKPNLDHLLTFPDVLWPEKTYVPLSWNPEAWLDEITRAELNSAIGVNLQKEISRALSEPGRQEFIEHFEKCILGDSYCGFCPQQELAQ